MLKYKITLNEPKGYDEIECESIFLSPSLDFISGVTANNKNELVDGQTIYIEINNDGIMIPVNVSLSKSLRQGYTKYYQKYQIETFDDHYGVRYNDGFYYIFEHEEGKNYVLKIPGIEDIIIDEIPSDNLIEIPTIYYIEDNKLKIGEITYDVNIDLKIKIVETKVGNKTIKNEDGLELYYNETIITLKDGVKLNIKLYDLDKWEIVTKFMLEKQSDLVMENPFVTCAKDVPYFIYGGEGENYILPAVSNLSEKRNYFNNKLQEEDGVIKTIKYCNTTDGKIFMMFHDTEKENYGIEKLYAHEAIKNGDKYEIKENGIKIKLKYESNISEHGDYLLITPTENYRYEEGQTIKVVCNDFSNYGCFLLDDEKGKYVEFDGKKYYKDEQNNFTYFVKINDKKYEVLISEYNWGIDTKTTKDGENKDVYGFIMVDNYPMLVIITEKKDDIICKIMTNIDKTYNYTGDSNSDSVITYKVDKMYYIPIDGEKKYIYLGDNNIEYVTLPNVNVNNIFISDIINGATLKCYTISDENASSIYRSIVNNQKVSNFYLINELFPSTMVSMENAILVKYNSSSEGVIKLFNPNKYYNIQLSTDNFISTNINQDDIVSNFFYKREVEKRINPIVDMEKEVYYPCFLNKNDISNFPELSLVNDIVFNLHFRTRDKEWKIIDDKSWNLFDSYNYSDNEKNKNPNILINNELAYNQPSDLLGFLNFTTDDVFYQKSKVGKSFLRLLFFNSPDPMKQTLLYSCTVFVNEGLLYKKYIDSIYLKNNKYIKVVKTDDNDGVYVSDNLDVKYDTLDGEKINFNEDRRLSMSFNVKNRYEASESSEGFYLYIFKEYCQRLHDEPIYMKVEFNHAGEGRTINFVMPFEQELDTDGNPSYDANGKPKYKLIDLSPGQGNEETINEFKNGLPLEKVFEHMYIPLESVYDFNNKRYCYYMPYWMTHVDNKTINNNDKTMTFSLYELKIKDES